MRAKSIISWLLTLMLIGGGLSLIAFSFFGQGSQTTSTNEASPDGFNVPEVSEENGGQASQDTGGPDDKTLEVSIPEMSRVEGDSVPDAPGDDTQALDENAAIHLQGTGFPWQDEANVYLAGHRLGYPGTDSFLALYDQDKLEEDDEIHVTDSEGTEYTYRVFESRVVSPTEVQVTRPVEGKNILTLQTCTLPNYSERLITRAELVETA